MIIINHTNQELFDHVCSHLAQQKQPALDGNGTCVYRTSSGLSCAVGCLIPDKQYDSDFEFTLVDDLVARSVLRFTAANIVLAMDLQNAHDRSDTASDLQSNLRSIANEWQLDANKVDLIAEWKVSRRQ